MVRLASKPVPSVNNFLFCITLESVDINCDLETEVQQVNYQGNPPLSPPEIAIPDHYINNVHSTPDLNAIMNRNIRDGRNGTTDRRNVIRDSFLEESVQLEGRNLNHWSLMYIDDMNIGEVHAMEKAKSLFSQMKERRTVHATYCEEKFKKIEEKSNDIGMVINAAKTQLLCVSASNSADIKTYSKCVSTKICSSNSLKILCFINTNSSPACM